MVLRLLDSWVPILGPYPGDHSSCPAAGAEQIQRLPSPIDWPKAALGKSHTHIKPQFPSLFKGLAQTLKPVCLTFGRSLNFTELQSPHEQKRFFLYCDLIMELMHSDNGRPMRTVVATNMK